MSGVSTRTVDTGYDPKNSAVNTGVAPNFTPSGNGALPSGVTPTPISTAIPGASGGLNTRTAPSGTGDGRVDGGDFTGRSINSTTATNNSGPYNSPTSPGLGPGGGTSSMTGLPGQVQYGPQGGISPFAAALYGSGQAAPQSGPNPTPGNGGGYMDDQGNLQGFNSNPFAAYLGSNDPQAQLIGRELTAGQSNMQNANRWLMQNVRQGASSANQGAAAFSPYRPGGNPALSALAQTPTAPAAPAPTTAAPPQPQAAPPVDTSFGPGQGGPHGGPQMQQFMDMFMRMFGGGGNSGMSALQQPGGGPLGGSSGSVAQRPPAVQAPAWNQNYTSPDLINSNGGGFNEPDSHTPAGGGMNYKGPPVGAVADPYATPVKPGGDIRPVSDTGGIAPHGGMGGVGTGPGPMEDTAPWSPPRQTPPVAGGPPPGSPAYLAALAGNSTF